MIDRRKDLIQFFIVANTSQDYPNFNLDTFVDEYIQRNKDMKKNYVVRVYNEGNIQGHRTEYGTEEYSLHREDGPAVEFVDGCKWWYINNERHREDGPAMTWGVDGKSWWKHGIYHREDGPAWIEGDVKRWFLNGKNLTESEFNLAISPEVDPLITQRYGNIHVDAIGRGWRIQKDGTLIPLDI